AIAGAQIEFMALDHGDDVRFHPVERQIEAAIINRRRSKNKLAFADRQGRRPAAILQADLLLGALPLSEREHALAPPDRHPAEGLPRRMSFLPRRLLLLTDDGRYRRAKLELTQSTRRRS